MKTLLVTAVLLIFGASQAQARNLSAMDGKTLLTDCHAAERMDEVSPKLTKEEWSAGFYCLGFVQGTIDADNIWQTAETKALGSKALPLVLYCLPGDASWPQLVRILVKWLENNPAKLDLPGYDVINMAMSDSYTCKTTAP
jgi:Rap1a immunity proteins